MTWHFHPMEQNSLRVYDNIKKLELWDVATGANTATLEGHTQ